MAINKEAYRKAQEYYRQWNEAELKERIRNAGKLTPEEGWEQYRSLVEFCWKLSPQQSEWQQKKKLEAITSYYDKIKKFQALGKGRWKKN